MSTTTNKPIDPYAIASLALTLFAAPFSILTLGLSFFALPLAVFLAICSVRSNRRAKYRSGSLVVSAIAMACLLVQLAAGGLLAAKFVTTPYQKNERVTVVNEDGSTDVVDNFVDQPSLYEQWKGNEQTR